MKKIILTIALALCALAAGAQVKVNCGPILQNVT